MSETSLGVLLKDLGGALTERTARIVVRELTLDSREAAPGVLFLARRGAKTHGVRFAAEALGRGASAVLYDPIAEDGTGMSCLEGDNGAVPRSPQSGPCVPLPGPEARLGEIARRFYGDASRDLALTAVTGTNGKTTVAWLLTQAWRALDPPRGAAYLGTLGVEWGTGERVALERTTPDVVTLHRWCARLRDAKIGHLVCEASSHALVQGRLDGLRIRTAVFTNLSPEHLDYHRNLEEYREAKWRLFARPELANAALNVGDACGRLFSRRLLARPPAGETPVVRVVRYGAEEDEAEFRAGNVVAGVSATRFDLLGPSGERKTLRVGLLGGFNVENLLAVAAALHAEGVEFERMASVFPALSPPPGRLEFVCVQDGPTVVVDFAHTPAALAAVLGVCRSLTRGRLIVVFGCGGERDRSKRPAMGKLASEQADRVILTDDNPRHEDPEAITDEILAGVPPGDPRVSVEHDRARAIAQALAEAAAGDLVLLAGKGHEETQVYGTDPRPFSDLGVVRDRLGGRIRPC